jgi:hypothetical protein
MNTQQLIHTLASDLQTGAGPTRSRLSWLRLALMTGLASLVSLAAILLLLAPSPHLVHGRGDYRLSVGGHSGGRRLFGQRSLSYRKVAGLVVAAFAARILLLGLG